MRWIVLALSLGAAMVSIIHGVFALLLSSSATQSVVSGSSSGTFTWLTGIMLFLSAALALIGGTLGFNRRRLGGAFLIVAAMVCFFINTDTRIYGALYFLAGLIAFFVPRLWDDGVEEEDFDDDRDEIEEDRDESYKNDEEPARPRGRAVTYGARKKEYVAKIRQGDENEVDEQGKVEMPMSLNRVRIRSSKVCPACGASVGIEHKFCFVCGGSLHARNSIEEDEDAPVVKNTQSGNEAKTSGLLDSAPLSDLKPVSPIDGDLSFDEATKKAQEEESALNRVLFDDEAQDLKKDDAEEDNEEVNEFEEEEIPISAPHKVFVKPIKDEAPIPKRSFVVNPDSSYQEFSNYARRRKRRRNSLFHRVLGPLLLVMVIGGIAWFLLGLRKLPEKELPIPPTVQSTPVNREEPSAGPIAVPSNEGQAEGNKSSKDTLGALRIEAPTTGIVLGSNVNLRAEHTTTGTVVTRLNSDARGEILERWEGTTGNLTGTWFRLRINGKEGWVFGRYFQPLDARATSLPPGYVGALLKAFGSKKSEAPQVVGRPSKTTATSLSWAGLTINYRGSGEALKAQISSSKHVLPNGVGVGISEESLFAKMGYPSAFRSGQLIYLENPNRGVGIKMKDGKVQSITVGEI